MLLQLQHHRCVVFKSGFLFVNIIIISISLLREEKIFVLLLPYFRCNRMQKHSLKDMWFSSGLDQQKKKKSTPKLYIPLLLCQFLHSRLIQPTHFKKAQVHPSAHVRAECLTNFAIKTFCTSRNKNWSVKVFYTSRNITGVAEQ